MVDNPQIGKLYKRVNDWTEYQEKDAIIVTGIKEIDYEMLVCFYYLDNPEEICEWNYEAFQDGMVEL